MKKQADGRYRNKIKVGVGPDGKPIFKYASGRTKKELAANAEELKRKYVGGVEVKRDVIFGAYLVEWYEAYRKPKIGASSQRNYANIINKHILPTFGDRQLRAIRPIELQTFLNQYAGKGETTLTYLHSVLKGMFERATIQGILDKNTAMGLEKPAYKTKERRALTEAETAAALRVGNEHPYGLLLLILYYTGMRRGEALGLQGQDINFKEGFLSVRRDVDYVTNQVGDVKTANALRDIPIPSALMAALAPIRGAGEAFILSIDGSSFWCSSTYVSRWKALMEAMYQADNSIESVNGASVLTAHYFRHNYATFLFNAGVDVLTAQLYLGHADAKTTLDIYTHLGAEKEKKSAAKLMSAFDQIKVAEKLPGTEKVITLEK